MNTTTQAISPLRQRMIDDMRMRKFTPKTQSGYLRAVTQFAVFLGRSPDTASAEDLRRYQLHMVDQGVSAHHLRFEVFHEHRFYTISKTLSANADTGSRCHAI